MISRLHAEITGEVLPSSSIRAFVENWLKAKACAAQATQDFCKASTAKFLAHLGPLADDELSMISKEHLVIFRNTIREKLSAKATNHYLKVVRMLFRAAKRDGYLVDDPSEFVETIKDKGHDKRRRRPFSLDEIRSLLAVADDEWRSMILCGLYTGQRIGDLARFTWADVDLEKDQIKLVTRKTGKALTIPMAAPLRASHRYTAHARRSPRTRAAASSRLRNRHSAGQKRRHSPINSPTFSPPLVFARRSRTASHRARAATVAARLRRSPFTA